MAQTKNVEKTTSSTVNFGTVSIGDWFDNNNETFIKLPQVQRNSNTFNAYRWPDGAFRFFQNTDDVIAFSRVLLKAEE